MAARVRRGGDARVGEGAATAAEATRLSAAASIAKTCSCFVAMLAGIAWLYPQLPAEYTPREDRGTFFVIISGPTKSADVPTVVHGVNTADGETRVLSCASCTTNNITPVLEILDRYIGIEKAIMTTVHAYTSTQELIDTPKQKDFRRGRAAAQNIIPTTTGAAKASTKALPQLEGKFDGISMRVPVITGSISDMVFVTKRDTSSEEVNEIFRKEAATDRYKGILGVTDEPLVSSDIIGETHASVVDLGMTRVVDGDLLKVLAWYDNEWSYTSQMIREAVSTLKNAGLVPA